MKYEINYGAEIEKDPETARRKAINDMIRYIGKKRTGLLIRGIRVGGEEGVRDFEHLRTLCGLLLGVEGYPVRALWEYVVDGGEDE